MNQPLILDLPPPINILQTSQLPDFCRWQIPSALTHLFDLPGGQILRQSLKGFLVYTELFEYHINEPFIIRGNKDGSDISMFLMLEGNTTILDKDRKSIIELTASSYNIISVAKGEYYASLPAGDHKLLIITFRPDWFVQKLPGNEKFKKLIAHHLDHASNIFALPYCLLNKNIIRRLKKHLTTGTNSKNNTSDFLSNFLFQLVENYSKMLTNNNLATSVIHKNLAAELLFYVQFNFSEPTLEDSTIAKHFNISETSLQNIFKAMYARPIGKHINLLRINLAMILVTRTNKPIGEIALLTGFKDSHYFSRAFKKHFHQPPTEVRTKSI